MLLKKRNNFIINILILCSILLFCGQACSNNRVLVSELYPNYIKTPQDIENWLIAEGFYYKPDKTRADQWKTPEQTIKDKGNDCEDYAILTAYILKDLGYKNVMIIAIYGKDLRHGITWFQEKDSGWSFFSTERIEDGPRFYIASKLSNPFYILYYYFSNWTHSKLCTEDGLCVELIDRYNIERGNK